MRCTTLFFCFKHGVYVSHIPLSLANLHKKLKQILFILESVFLKSQRERKKRIQIFGKNPKKVISIPSTSMCHDNFLATKR